MRMYTKADLSKPHKREALGALGGFVLRYDLPNSWFVLRDAENSLSYRYSVYKPISGQAAYKGVHSGTLRGVLVEINKIRVDPEYET